MGDRVLSAGDEADFLVAFLPAQPIRTISASCARVACCFATPTTCSPTWTTSASCMSGVPITGLTVEALGGTAKDAGQECLRARPDLENLPPRRREAAEAHLRALRRKVERCRRIRRSWRSGRLFLPGRQRPHAALPLLSPWTWRTPRRSRWMATRPWPLRAHRRRRALRERAIPLRRGSSISGNLLPQRISEIWRRLFRAVSRTNWAPSSMALGFSFAGHLSVTEAPARHFIEDGGHRLGIHGGDPSSSSMSSAEV